MFDRYCVVASLMGALVSCVCFAESSILVSPSMEDAKLPDTVQVADEQVFLTGPAYEVNFPDAAGQMFCPADIALPEGTQFAGCWIRGKDVRAKLDFVFADAQGRETVVSTSGPIDNSWDFRGVTPPPGASTLLGVRVVHGKGVSGTLWVSNWMADESSPSAHRDFIWQLKSLEFSKRFTYYRTGRQFLWSGFDEDTFLPVGCVLSDPEQWFYLPEETPYLAYGLSTNPAPADGSNLAIVVQSALNTGQIIDTQTCEITDYDPQTDNLDRIPLHLSEPGSYQITASVYEDGVYIGSRQFVLTVSRNTQPESYPHETNGQAGQLVCTPLLSGGHPVFEAGEPVALDWQGQVPAGGPVQLRYEVFDYTYHACGTGEVEAEADSDGQWHESLTLPELAPGAYYLRLKVVQDGQCYGEAWQILGVRADPEEAPTGPVRAPASYDELFGPEGGLAMQMDVYPLDKHVGQSVAYCIERNERADSTPIVCFYWGDLEPLPGVYQFSLIDQWLEKFSEAGLRVFLSPMIIADVLPEWIWYDICLNQRGTGRFSPMLGHTYVSPSSRLYRDNQLNFIRAFVRHFRDNPTVLGYYFPHNGAEGFYPFFSDPELVPDYSEPARKAFQAYLRDERAYTLADINERYGLSLETWEQLECPLPDFDAPLDTRPQWQDFMDFQQHVVDHWVTRVIETAREEDPERPLLQYGLWGFGAIESFLDVFHENHVVLGNGGSDTAVATYLMGLAKNNDIVAISESTHTPPFEAALNLSAFNNLGTGNFRANDLCWNHLAHRFQGDAAIDPLLDYYTAWQRELIPHLRNAQVVGKTGAVLVSPRSLILRTRYFSSLAWLQDADFSALMYGTLEARWMPSWISENTPQWERFSMVWDTGIVQLDTAARQKMRDYVAGGGTLITSLKTDSLPGDGQSRANAFFEGLGLRFAQDKPLYGLTAPLLVDSPLGAKGQSLQLSQCRPLAEVPDGAQVLARDLMGRPVIIRLPDGKGAFLIVSGQIDMRANPRLYASMQHALNGDSEVNVSDRDVWSAHLRDGSSDYIALINRPSSLQPYMNPKQGKVPGGISKGTWSFAGADDHMFYTVTNLLDVVDSHKVRGQALKAGIPFELPSGALAVYRISPAAPEAASLPISN